MLVNEYSLKKSGNGKPILVTESTFNHGTENYITNPEIAAEFLDNVFKMSDMLEEYLYLVTVNVKNKPTGVFEISHGSLNLSIVDPKAVFTRALLLNASGILLAHNHPSGDISPSESDIETTNRIKNAAELLGIQFLDHLIIGKSDIGKTVYFSFKESGQL